MCDRYITRASRTLFTIQILHPSVFPHCWHSFWISSLLKTIPQTNEKLLRKMRCVILVAFYASLSDLLKQAGIQLIYNTVYWNLYVGDTVGSWFIVKQTGFILCISYTYTAANDLLHLNMALHYCKMGIKEFETFCQRYLIIFLIRTRQFVVHNSEMQTNLQWAN